MPGDSLTYTLRVTNTGNVTLTGLVVTDSLPSELGNPTNVVLPSGATGGFTGSILEVTLAALAPGASVEITFEVDIAADVAAGTVIRNTATVEDPNDESGVRDGDESLTTVVECPPCPSGEQCPPCPPRSPGQSETPDGQGANPRQLGTPSRPTLPQTGAVVGLSVLCGTALAVSGLAVASKKKGKARKPSLELEESLDQEYNGMFE